MEKQRREIGRLDCLFVIINGEQKTACGSHAKCYTISGLGGFECLVICQLRCAICIDPSIKPFDILINHDMDMLDDVP